MNCNAIMSVLLFLLCVCHYYCFGEPGCMDNSWHLKQPYDYKEFHYVSASDGGYCHCPCSQYIAQYGKSISRGRCPVCKHYHVPQPIVIINNALEKYKQYQKVHGREFKRVKKYKNFRRKIAQGDIGKATLTALKKLTKLPMNCKNNNLKS
jgi:hypothetical protein